MLLTTTPTRAGASEKKNAGTVVVGGNIPSNDRVTQAPSMGPINGFSGILGNFTFGNYISAGVGGSLYLGSGVNGGTLAQNDRDDAVIYYSQKRDLAGVANSALAQSVTGPSKEPHSTVSGSYTLYGSGYSLSGTPISAPSVGGESYGTADNAATTAGHGVYFTGGPNPTSGNYPQHV